MTIQEHCAKEVVEHYYQIKLNEKTRRFPYVEARAVYFKLVRDNSHLSFSKIGMPFGKDHTTVLYLCNKIQDWMETDKNFLATYHLIQSAYEKILELKPKLVEEDLYSKIVEDNDYKIKDINLENQKEIERLKKEKESLKKIILTERSKRKKYEKMYSEKINKVLCSE